MIHQYNYKNDLFGYPGLQKMALEKFNIIVNTPTTLPSHHFSVRPGGGSGPTVPPAVGVTRAPEDRRSPMKITNFDPSQDYHRLVRQHSANRLFEVTLYMFENFVKKPGLRSRNRNRSEPYSFGDFGTGTGTVFGIRFRFRVQENEAKNLKKINSKFNDFFFM
jgi:hypothetical protein